MLAVKAFSAAAKFDPEAAQKKAEAEWSAKTPQEKEASFDLLRSIEAATDGSGIALSLAQAQPLGSL